MASRVAQLRYPSGVCVDPLFASDLGPQHSAPVDEDDDDDGVTYREVEDDPIDLETTCPGQSFTTEEEEDISLNWIERWSDLLEQFSDSCDVILSEGGQNARLPPGPLKVLPETTSSCITREYCYHREYMTTDTSQTKSTLGFRRPQDMMQIFFLRLSGYKCESNPTSIYGIFAVRDDLEPLRNYVFNRSRDNPVMIQQDSLALPLCSPCRGMYLLDRALLEVDLWMKKEGDGSTDEQLLSVYVEIDLGSSFDKMFTGRIHTDHCILDMDYMFLAQSIEAIIQVSVTVDDCRHVKFIAFSSCFGNEIVLFEGKCVEKGELFTYVVAVKTKGKLHVRLELENSLLEWTFQDGAAGALSYPHDDDSIPFHVRVLFAPNNGERGLPRYYTWKERCRYQAGKLPVLAF